MSGRDDVPGGDRRQYNSAVRREQVARTRTRIVEAGAELLHGFPIWNWRALTARAVAERAGVNERTVYRYFPSERELRGAVLERLGVEADVRLEELSLDQFDTIAARVLQYVSRFPIHPRSAVDPTVEAGKALQRGALRRAVSDAAPGWPQLDATIAAAMFDVLWNVVSYEQLVTEWGLSPEEAIAGVTWAIRLLREAVRGDDTPGTR